MRYGNKDITIGYREQVKKMNSISKFRNKIICGDAIEMMKKIPSGSIDIIVTSPPYNLKNSTGNGMKDGRGGKWANAALVNGYANYNDNMPHEEYKEWQRNCLSEMMRLIPENGAIFYNHKWRVQAGILQDRHDIVSGFPVRQIIIWRRKGGINFNPGYFLPTYEVIYLIAKPKFKLVPKANAYGDVWEFMQEMKNDHPAPFPVALIERIIESTNASIILDPFMGSGTTAIAAINLNRAYVGIEISKDYVKYAKKRILEHPIRKKEMKTFTKDSLIRDLRNIQARGWIKISEKRNTNAGAVGNILEDLLGIEENNLPLPNAAEWELKATRRNSSSLITLFHMEPSPTAMKFVPQVLLPIYGWRHKEAGKKYNDNERSFRQTIKSKSVSDRGFFIYVDRENEKIEVNFDPNKVSYTHKEWLSCVLNSGGGTLKDKPYWGLNDIYHKLGTKLHNCFFAIADEKKEGEEKYLSYTEIYMLRSLSKENFLNAFIEGLIYVDFDARSGHNHGTKFRIKETDIYHLYDEVVKI